jgi:hypothetical protein
MIEARLEASSWLSLNAGSEFIDPRGQPVREVRGSI